MSESMRLMVSRIDMRVHVDESNHQLPGGADRRASAGGASSATLTIRPPAMAMSRTAESRDADRSPVHLEQEV